VFATLVPAGLATFYLARRGDDVVAANLVLRHRDRACDWMWVYDDRFPQLRATNLLIDRAVRDEAARGTRELNLGASPTTASAASASSTASARRPSAIPSTRTPARWWAWRATCAPAWGTSARASA